MKKSDPAKKNKGFKYFIEKEKIEEYRRWPVERKLAWLYGGNRLRKSIPPDKIALQDRFRRGEL